MRSATAWAGPSALVFAIQTDTVTGGERPSPVVRLDLETGERRRLFWATGMFPFRGAAISGAVLSRVGDHGLVFDACAQFQALCEVEIDANAGRPRRVLGGVAVDRQPCWDPDGRRVLFTSNRSGNIDLFSYEPGTGEIFQVTHHPGSDWDGGFSADGSSILWSSDRTGNLEIWMADADGTNPRQVSHDGFDAENPTMTRDGRWIVYSSGNPDHPGIFKVRPDGTEQQEVVAGASAQPEVSPDGRYLFYLVGDRGGSRISIQVVDLETGELLPFHAEISIDPRAPNMVYGRGRWMPDGSAIVYLGLDEQARTGLWIQDFRTDRNTLETRRPLHGFDGSQIHESFGIAPDGKSLIVSTVEQVRTIQLADRLPRLR